RNSTGKPSPFQGCPVSSDRRATRSLGSPAVPMPETSPFTSARKTGMPAAESCSARSWSVLVFPVPVAPAIRPWRVALARVDRRAQHDGAGIAGERLADRLEDLRIQCHARLRVDGPRILARERAG